jgi:hypothetical protein
MALIPVFISNVTHDGHLNGVLCSTEFLSSTQDFFEIRTGKRGNFDALQQKPTILSETISMAKTRGVARGNKVGSGCARIYLDFARQL